MRRKVMYITQSNGGVARYLQMLFKYMDRDKYEQILIYPTEHKNEQEKFIDFVDNIEFVDMCREINPIKDFKSIVEINRLIKKYNPDLIYVQSSKGGAIGRIANLLEDKPIVYNAHGWAFNMKVSKLKRRIYVFIERVLASVTDSIIAISDEEKNSAISNKICSEEKIKVILNGIDIEEYDNSKISELEVKSKYNIPFDSRVFGMVGRISEQKAPDIFIRVASEINKKLPNSFFIIVGDGEDKANIELLIDELGIKDKTLITGWVDNIYEYISTFDIAMLLSRWEGFGLAIAEYMIANKPIIATNVDSIPILVENEINGLLVSVDNVDEVVEAVFKIINDSELANKFIENSNEKARINFNVKRVAFEHETLFKSIFK